MTNPRIDAILDAVQGPAVLDLGCVQPNADRDAEWLHGRLFRHPDVETLVGIDIVEDAITDLQREGFNVKLADATNYRPHRQYNTVVAGELLEHVEDPGGLLYTARQALTDDGRLILTTPNPWAIGHLLRWVYHKPTINDEHVAWYGPVVLRQLLQRYDFRVRELRPINYVTPKARLLKRLGFETFGASTWFVVAEKA